MRENLEEISSYEEEIEDEFETDRSRKRIKYTHPIEKEAGESN